MEYKKDNYFKVYLGDNATFSEYKKVVREMIREYKLTGNLPGEFKTVKKTK